jgi:hypothetical protein
LILQYLTLSHRHPPRDHLWFTEGFDTLDLKEAKALLEDLAA